MEAQTDIQTYLEQGKQALAHGQGREAAIAYAHGAQMEPDNPVVHLGLAEANLALNTYGVVHMACKRVQELQPEGGQEGWTAQALLDLLDHRYERALQNIDAVISGDPGNAYAHALRSYLLRAQGQDYDANLARARAARLSFGGRFEGCFPALESTPTYGGYKGNTTASSAPIEVKTAEESTGRSSAKQEQVPNWSRPSPLRRQMIRTRFTLSQYPNLVTTLLVAINVIVYLILAIIGGNITQIPENLLILAGAQIVPGEYWRIFTSLFIHASFLQLALNSLSLFLVGRSVEALYGKWRYLAIYILSGVISGLVVAILGGGAIGATSSVFGIFGAIGVFFIVNRRALGAYGNGAIGQWLFWLGLNLIWGFSFGAGVSGIITYVTGLVSGMLVALLLMPRQRGRRLL